MKIEQSSVKITISDKEFEALMAARDVILEMKELLYYNDLSFYNELASLRCSFELFERNFEKNSNGDYCTEVE